MSFNCFTNRDALILSLLFPLGPSFNHTNTGMCYSEEEIIFRNSMKYKGGKQKYKTKSSFKLIFWYEKNQRKSSSVNSYTH